MNKFFIILLLFLSPLTWFANKQIDIETSAIRVVVGEEFRVTIRLTDIVMDQSLWDILLPGIENFDVFSQSTSNTFQDINGQTQSMMQLTLQLRAREAGEFVLWPVEVLANQELKDNEKINIIVDRKSWSPIQTVTPGTTSNTQTLQNNIVNEVMTQKDTWVFSWLRTMKFPIWAHGGFLVFFIGAFYLLLSYVLQPDSNRYKSSDETQNIPESLHDSQDYFIKLSSLIGEIESKDFFHRYNIGLRNIFWDILWFEVQSDTLTELSKHELLLSKQEFLLFKKSYKHEYSWVSISQETQKKYIENILNILW